MKSNVKEDVCYVQPKTLEQRIAIANDFVQRLKYPVPFGIDDMTNAANDAYAAWPERIYIIDERGRIGLLRGLAKWSSPSRVPQPIGEATAKSSRAKD
jgi:hypothetical protein